jgi:hypothetical protein
MPRNTSNKSMRIEDPNKALRREQVADESDEANLTVPGASGEPRSGAARPGRAASLRGIASQARPPAARVKRPKAKTGGEQKRKSRAQSTVKLSRPHA